MFASTNEESVNDPVKSTGVGWPLSKEDVVSHISVGIKLVDKCAGSHVKAGSGGSGICDELYSLLPVDSQG